MGSSPLQGMVAQQMMQKLANRGQIGGNPTGAGEGGGEGAGAQLQQQFSELNNADPGFMMKALTQIKQLATVVMAMSAFPSPEVSRKTRKIMDACDDALKAAQETAETAQVAKPNMIANNTALPQPGPQQDVPGQMPGIG